MVQAMKYGGCNPLYQQILGHWAPSKPSHAVFLLSSDTKRSKGDCEHWTLKVGFFSAGLLLVLVNNG